jgi:hypothetical protein
MVPVPSVVVNSGPPSEHFRLTADDPLSGLTKWLADSRVDAAATARAQQRWLEHQATEESTITGVLVDLAERGRPVAVRSTAGRNIRGRVFAIGADFVAIREARIGDVLIPRHAIATVRSAPGDEPVVGDRPAALDVVLAEALVEIAASRPVVLIGTAGDEYRGELHSAGQDLVSLTLDGERRETIHVATSSIDHLIVLAA